MICALSGNTRDVIVDGEIMRMVRWHFSCGVCEKSDGLEPKSMTRSLFRATSARRRCQDCPLAASPSTLACLARPCCHPQDKGNKSASPVSISMWKHSDGRVDLVYPGQTQHLQAYTVQSPPQQRADDTPHKGIAAETVGAGHAHQLKDFRVNKPLMAPTSSILVPLVEVPGA